jgi:hypothetical protein
VRDDGVDGNQVTLADALWHLDSRFADRIAHQPHPLRLTRTLV